MELLFKILVVLAIVFVLSNGKKEKK